MSRCSPEAGYYETSQFQDHCNRAVASVAYFSTVHMAQWWQFMVIQHEKQLHNRGFGWLWMVLGQGLGYVFLLNQTPYVLPASHKLSCKLINLLHAAAISTSSGTPRVPGPGSASWRAASQSFSSCPPRICWSDILSHTTLVVMQWGTKNDWLVVSMSFHFHDWNRYEATSQIRYNYTRIIAVGSS